MLGKVLEVANAAVQNKYGAQRALLRNGEQLSPSLMVGVKPLDPVHRAAIQDHLQVRRRGRCANLLLLPLSAGVLLPLVGTSAVLAVLSWGLGPSFFLSTEASGLFRESGCSLARPAAIAECRLMICSGVRQCQWRALWRLPSRCSRAAISSTLTARCAPVTLSCRATCYGNGRCAGNAGCP